VKTFKPLVLLLLLLNPALILAGGQARSLTYSFDYTAVGLGGGVSEAGIYHMVSYADQSNSASGASSLSYSITPVVGGSPDDSSVADWELYN